MTTLRRDFLRGSIGLVGGALVASACSGGSAESAPSTVPPEVPDENVWPLDVTLAQTSVSLELASRRIADELLATGLIANESAVRTIDSARSHHGSRRDLFVPVVAAAAVEVVDDPNALLIAVLQPRMSQIVGEVDAVTIAAELVGLTSQVHVWMATQFTTPELRAQAASLAGALRREYALLRASIGLDPFGADGAFVVAENPAPTAVIRG